MYKPVSENRRRRNENVFCAKLATHPAIGKSAARSPSLFSSLLNFHVVVLMRFRISVYLNITNAGNRSAKCRFARDHHFGAVTADDFLNYLSFFPDCSPHPPLISGVAVRHSCTPTTSAHLRRLGGPERLRGHGAAATFVFAAALIYFLG